MRNPKSLIDTFVGWAVLGGLITGLTSLIAALVLFVLGSATAAGVCLIAAALAFGLLSIAVLAT